jgi:hypothetical protein
METLMKAVTNSEQFLNVTAAVGENFAEIGPELRDYAKKRLELLNLTEDLIQYGYSSDVQKHLREAEAAIAIEKAKEYGRISKIRARLRDYPGNKNTSPTDDDALSRWTTPISGRDTLDYWTTTYLVNMADLNAGARLLNAITYKNNVTNPHILDVQYQKYSLNHMSVEDRYFLRTLPKTNALWKKGGTFYTSNTEQNNPTTTTYSWTLAAFAAAVGCLPEDWDDWSFPCITLSIVTPSDDGTDITSTVVRSVAEIYLRHGHVFYNPVDWSMVLPYSQSIGYVKQADPVTTQLLYTCWFAHATFDPTNTVKQYIPDKSFMWLDQSAEKHAVMQPNMWKLLNRTTGRRYDVEVNRNSANQFLQWLPADWQTKYWWVGLGEADKTTPVQVTPLGAYVRSFGVLPPEVDINAVYATDKEFFRWFLYEIISPDVLKGFKYFGDKVSPQYENSETIATWVADNFNLEKSQLGLEFWVTLFNDPNTNIIDVVSKETAIALIQKEITLLSMDIDSSARNILGRYSRSSKTMLLAPFMNKYVAAVHCHETETHLVLFDQQVIMLEHALINSIIQRDIESGSCVLLARLIDLYEELGDDDKNRPFDGYNVHHPWMHSLCITVNGVLNWDLSKYAILVKAVLEQELTVTNEQIAPLLQPFREQGIPLHKVTVGPGHITTVADVLARSSFVYLGIDDPSIITADELLEVGVHYPAVIELTDPSYMWRVAKDDDKADQVSELPKVLQLWDAVGISLRMLYDTRVSANNGTQVPLLHFLLLNKLYDIHWRLRDSKFGCGYRQPNSYSGSLGHIAGFISRFDELDAWGWADDNGVTVAHILAVMDKLPIDSKYWFHETAVGTPFELFCKYARVRKLPGFTQWAHRLPNGDTALHEYSRYMVINNENTGCTVKELALKDKYKRTVAEVAAERRNLGFDHPEVYQWKTVKGEYILHTMLGTLRIPPNMTLDDWKLTNDLGWSSAHIVAASTVKFKLQPVRPLAPSEHNPQIEECTIIPVKVLDLPCNRGTTPRDILAGLINIV